MDTNAKIYVAGHKGLVGQSLVQELKSKGYNNLLTASHAELDLCDQVQVKNFFSLHQPEYVFLAAAKVGGIYANRHFPGDFIHQNLMIQANVIHQAKQFKVKRLLFLGSSCIYPRMCPQPIKEDYLLTSPLEMTNRPYAVAKISGIEMCWAYNRQYHTNFLAVMPTNLYGPGDNFDLKTSHVIPAIIRKMHEAKIHHQPKVEIWGTGTPKREFLYSSDLARACIFLMGLDNARYQTLVHSETQPPLVNIGTGQDISISELARMVAEVVGYSGELTYNSDYPDGTPRKLLDVSKINGLGWKHEISLPEGLKRAYLFYKNKLQQLEQVTS